MPSELRGFYRGVPLYTGDPPEPYTDDELKIIDEFRRRFLSREDTGHRFRSVTQYGMTIIEEAIP